LRRAPERVRPFLASPDRAQRLLRVIGASEGAAEFFLRQPAELDALRSPITTLPSAQDLRDDLLDSVGAVDGFAETVEEQAWTALRIRYRRRLMQIASFDLEQED